MENITLEHIHKDIGEIKFELKRIYSIIEEDFELSESTKKELEKARKERGLSDKDFIVLMHGETMVLQ